MNRESFKKTNVPLMVLLSIFTGGIYIAYWFLSRRKSFEQLNINQLIFSFVKILLVINVTLFVYSLVKNALFSELGILVIDSFDIILTFISLGFLYFSVFRAREAIEDEVSETIYHPLLLLLFHIWYVQFKLNRSELVERAK